MKDWSGEKSETVLQLKASVNGVVVGLYPVAVRCLLFVGTEQGEHAVLLLRSVWAGAPEEPESNHHSGKWNGKEIGGKEAREDCAVQLSGPE